MPDPDDLLRFLWLTGLVLIICLVGMLVVITIRTMLGLNWRFSRLNSKKGASQNTGNPADPWKTSAQRLTIAQLRQVQGEDHDDSKSD